MESTVTSAESAHPITGPHHHVAGETLGQFEFDHRDNAVIESLSARMYFVGWSTLAVGLFVIALGAFLLNIGSILSGTLYAVIGLWTHRASVSFGQIARTRGRDVSHLMSALRDLRNLYTLQIWICTFMLAAAFFGALCLAWQR